MKQFLSLLPPPRLSKETFIAGGCTRALWGAAEQSCVGGDAPGVWSKKQVFPLPPGYRKRTFPWPQSISGPPCPALTLFSPKQVPWALALLLPLQQLALLSLCPQTWLKGTCSWDTLAGISEQTPAPSPPLRWKASPRWPCATATTTSAASPWRQVLLQAGAGRRDVASSGFHLPAGWKSPCLIRGDLAVSDTSPNVLLGALSMTPMVPDKAPCVSPCTRTHTHLPFSFD